MNTNLEKQFDDLYNKLKALSTITGHLRQDLTHWDVNVNTKPIDMLYRTLNKVFDYNKQLKSTSASNKDAEYYKTLEEKINNLQRINTKFTQYLKDNNRYFKLGGLFYDEKSNKINFSHNLADLDVNKLDTRIFSTAIYDKPTERMSKPEQELYKSILKDVVSYLPVTNTFNDSYKELEKERKATLEAIVESEKAELAKIKEEYYDNNTVIKAKEDYKIKKEKFDTTIAERDKAKAYGDKLLEEVNSTDIFKKYNELNAKYYSNIPNNAPGAWEEKEKILKEAQDLPIYKEYEKAKGIYFNLRDEANSINPGETEDEYLQNVANQYKNKMADLEKSIKTREKSLKQIEKDEKIAAKVQADIEKNNTQEIEKIQKETTDNKKATLNAEVDAEKAATQEIEKIQKEAAQEVEKTQKDVAQQTEKIQKDTAQQVEKIQKSVTQNNTEAVKQKIKDQQVSDASALSASLARIQKREELSAVESTKQKNKLSLEDSKQAHKLEFEDSKQAHRLELENVKQQNREVLEDKKATLRAESEAKKAATSEAARAERLASEEVKQQNRLALEEQKTNNRIRIEQERAALKEQNQIRKEERAAERAAERETKREAAKAERDSARETARAAREAKREAEKAEREAARQTAKEKRETEKAEREAARQTAKEKRETEKAEREAARQTAKEKRETEKAEREAARQTAKEKRELDRENARNQREVAKAEREATRQKEKEEREAARATAKAERESAREAEKAARDKKDAWKTVGDTIKKVASTITSAMSKALSLIKKDIQLTVNLSKKAITAFKTIGNTVLRVLNLFGNFGDRLKQFFDKGIINGITSGLNRALNSIVDIPERILNNRFVQVGENLLSSIQSLNILIGDDLTNSTIGWAKELERGFGLSADGLISDMKSVAGVMKGLGMTGGDTATAAKNLTVMSRSFSVMLGYKPEEAMSKIESGMKGMTQSVDDLGISVREAEMNSFLKELKARGGEFSNIATSFSNLNEEQRVYVRYAAMIDQYLKAFSIEKYAKSLDTITGRLSILREQTRAFISAVGNLFLQMFNKIVVPLTYTINWLTSKIKALTNYLGLSSELSSDINGATDAVSTTIDTSGTVDGLNKEADALDKVNKAAKEAKGGIDSFDHVTSMRSSSSSSGSGSDDGTGSDFDYSKLMDLNADDIASKMEQMSKAMDDYTNSAKQKTVEGLQKIKSAIDKWYKEQTNEDLDWSRIFNSKGLDKTFSTLLNNIKRSIKGVTNIIGPLLLKVAQDINLNRLLRKSLTLVTEAFGALADALEFIKPILFELYDEIISPLVVALGEKLSAALDNATNRLKKFRDDIKSGKYTNIKIVIRTLLTGETSETDLNYLNGNDIMKGTNLSKLNTIAEKIHTVFEEIYTLVKSTASIIFDTIKETFNGEHKTLLDVIKSTLEKVSNFVSENHDAIVEILTALLELQATVIEAVINAILDIAKWIVEHKDLVVSVLNKIKDVVEWLGNHVGLVIGFYIALKTLSILTTVTAAVKTFVTTLGTLKTALGLGGAASAGGAAAGGAATGGAAAGGAAAGGAATRAGARGASTMPDVGNARSTDLGGNAAGAAGGTTFLSKAAPIAGWTALAAFTTGSSSYQLNKHRDELVDMSQRWRGLSEEVRNTEMALAKANGQGFIGTGADAQSVTKNSGFFGVFKEIKSYFDYGDTSLTTEYVQGKAEEYASRIKNALDGTKVTYERIEKLLKDGNIEEQFRDLGYGEEVTNAAIAHFKAVLYDELEDSIEKDTKKLSDISINTNNHIADYVKNVSDSSIESHTKLKASVDSSIKTINSSTSTMKYSFGSISGSLNSVYSTMQTMMGTAINSVKSLKSNVNTLSTDVQLLNNDTNNALSAIRSALSTASSAMYSAMSGVMGTISNVVGIPSVRSIFGYANGGMPRSGQMFIAREDGMPELVGSFGGYSGVANNDMIIKAMREAIYDGTRAANASGGTNSNSGGTVNFNNYGYFGGDQASFRKFAAMINNANRSSNSNIANKTFRA